MSAREKRMGNGWRTLGIALVVFLAFAALNDVSMSNKVERLVKDDVLVRVSINRSNPHTPLLTEVVENLMESGYKKNGNIYRAGVECKVALADNPVRGNYGVSTVACSFQPYDENDNYCRRVSGNVVEDIVNGLQVCIMVAKRIGMESGMGFSDGKRFQF